jgi:hypothetical protein
MKFSCNELTKLINAIIGLYLSAKNLPMKWTTLKIKRKRKITTMKKLI